MIDALKKRTTVDQSKIFASGHSNGGIFMYKLASDPRTAHVFAALVASAGLPSNGFNRGTPNTNLRFIAFLGKRDDYVYPYPNVPSDPTESYSASYGWYYSAWDNTTNLWAAQRGLTSRKSLSSSQSGLECQGWSSDGTAKSASVASCFYDGGHGSTMASWTEAWEFFGFAAPQPSGDCPKTCSGWSCDEWYYYNGNTCAEEEKDYGCDCSGCKCPGGDVVV